MNKPLALFARIILGFVAVNALAGALSLMLFPSSTDLLFFWTITPPINAALFGALYFGGACMVGYLTWRGEWEPARFLVPVLVSAGMLISLTTFLHIDRFGPGIKLFYWLLVYVAAPLLALFIYWQQERGGANWKMTVPLAPLTLGIALVFGVALVGIGIFILIAPELFIPNWAWAISPLMIRIFASWFAAFGVGLLWFWIDRDWERVKYIAILMIFASALDLSMLFLHRNDLTTTGPLLWVYVFHLALFGVLGGVMFWVQQRAGLRHIETGKTVTQT